MIHISKWNKKWILTWKKREKSDLVCILRLHLSLIWKSILTSSIDKKKMKMYLLCVFHESHSIISVLSTGVSFFAKKLHFDTTLAKVAKLLPQIFLRCLPLFCVLYCQSGSFCSNSQNLLAIFLRALPCCTSSQQKPLLGRHRKRFFREAETTEKWKQYKHFFNSFVNK